MVVVNGVWVPPTREGPQAGVPADRLDPGVSRGSRNRAIYGGFELSD